MNTPQIATITNAIAGLSIPGLTICDLDQIPPDCTNVLPVIYPRPIDFITNLTTVVQSYGASAAKKDVSYRIHYRFCYAPIMENRLGLQYFPAMVQMAFDFIYAVLANDALEGAIDIAPVDVLSFSNVVDAVGNLYHGCDIALEILEFAQ